MYYMYTNFHNTMGISLMNIILKLYYYIEKRIQLFILKQPMGGLTKKTDNFSGHTSDPTHCHIHLAYNIDYCCNTQHFTL